MQRREFMKTTGAMALLAGTSLLSDLLAADAPKQSPLNLFFITADDMNATMPGWMGNPVKPTPRMDALAGESHRFVNNFASSPICQPSRQAMMTGLVPHRSGGYGFNPVRPGTPSLATILQSNGYFLGALNKTIHMAPQSVFPWDVSYDGCGKNPDLLGERMTTLIKTAKDAGKPFFINCNITDPHRPFYKAGDPARWHDGDVENLPHELQAKDVTVPSFLEDVGEVRNEIAQYYNNVQRMDVSIGKAIDALKAAGAYELTVIVFVSDHGMPFPFAKATVYSNGPWCPVLLRYPGMGPPRAFDEFTSSIDLMPTLLDLLGLPTPANIDGRSWATMLKGEKQPDRDFAISHVNTVSSSVYYPQRGVHTSEFALCFTPWAHDGESFRVESMQGVTFAAMKHAGESDPRVASRVEQYTRGVTLAFYDLKKDPDQRTNVIADERYKPHVDRLQKILFTHMEKTSDPEFDNFKRALAGKPVDTQSVGAKIKAEQQQLNKFKIQHGKSAAE